MLDVLLNCIFLIVSVIIAIALIIQTKGIYWYSPITNKTKMIMTIINVSILFMVLVFMHKAILSNIPNTIFISIICLVIIFLCKLPVISILKKFIALNKIYSEKSEIDTSQTSENINSIEEKNTLKEHLQKFITTFNVVFFVLNICYIIIIMACQEKDSYIDVITVDYSQSVSVTLLFWLTLVGALITSKDWNYTEVANSPKIKTEKNAHYFVRKIMNRNR